MNNQNPALKNVIIIGAGFSGITLAALLEESKLFNITVYENQHIGGVIKSEIINGLLFEHAAPSLLNHHLLENFLKRHNIRTIPALKSANKKYLYIDQMERWPLNLPENLQFAMKLLCFIFKSDKINTLKGLSVKDWSELYLGKVFTEKILRTALLGVYASDISELNAELVLGRFFKSENKTRNRGSIIPEGGITAFLNLLVEKLQKKDVQFLHKNLSTEEIINLQSNNIVVFATNIKDFINLVKPAPEKFINFEKPNLVSVWQILSGRIRNISLAKVLLVFENIKYKINGFGILFHPKNKFNSLGVIANNHFFSLYGPEYNESWIMPFKSENKILEDVISDRKRLFGIHSTIKNSALKISRDIYPVYDKTLLDWIKLTQLKAGYFATGNYWGGVGLTQIFLQNISLVERITAYAKK